MMEFRSPNAHTITTRLSRGDLEKMQMTFDALDYSNSRTRRMIHTILDSACRELHIQANTHGRMIVEAFAEHDGGCRIVYTLPPREGRMRLIVKRRRNPCVFAFSGIDCLLDACAALPVHPEGDLYQEGERYYLILYPGIRDRAVRLILKEYGHGVGPDPVALQRIREHARLLCRSDAVRRLSPVRQPMPPRADHGSSHPRPAH